MDAWLARFGSLGDAVVDDGNPFGPAMTGASDDGVEVYETFEVV